MIKIPQETVDKINNIVMEKDLAIYTTEGGSFIEYQNNTQQNISHQLKDIFHNTQLFNIFIQEIDIEGKQGVIIKKCYFNPIINKLINYDYTHDDPHIYIKNTIEYYYGGIEYYYNGNENRNINIKNVACKIYEKIMKIVQEHPIISLYDLNEELLKKDIYNNNYSALYPEIILYMIQYNEIYSKDFYKKFQLSNQKHDRQKNDEIMQNIEIKPIPQIDIT